ncbi:MAG: NRDE family protein [Ferruginibacter sp.]|nr:NRDE family protein [Cytophagales bacterium]
MCTVTYLPLSNNGYLLTSSRDEQAVRPLASPPRSAVVGGREVCFPRDPQGGGTWIAAAGRTAVCLLNGASEPHVSRPPYRHSRGLVPLHCFTFATIDQFLAQSDFGGIEPFTLVVAEPNRLVVLRWNGQDAAVGEADPRRAHLWSSVTLYTPSTRAKRTQWFEGWLRNHPVRSVANIRHFRRPSGDGDPANDLRMNRLSSDSGSQLHTVSLTSVRSESGQTDLFYEDLMASTFTHHAVANCCESV